jgi:DNA-binding response OmpR family regulator
VPPPGPTPDPPSRGPLVLVVEDEALIALDLELLLGRHGWRVLGPAATVAQALRLLEGGGEVPAVALLDANLRGEPATPVAERLRALRVPFVVASAYDGARLAALGLGGAPAVGKPARERVLLAALARAVRA